MKMRMRNGKGFNFRFLRSLLFWLAFFGGIILIALLGQAIFGKGSTDATFFCLGAGALWGAALVQWGTNR